MSQLNKKPFSEEYLSDWTVIVYFAADNDLIPAAAADLLDMKEVGSTKRVNVIAQNIVPATGLTARYRLRKGTFLDEDVLQLLEPNAEHPPESLSDFACWAIDTYPAKRYMVVLWGHGLGWEGHDPHPVDTKNTTGRKMNSADKILNVGKRRTLNRLMQNAPTALSVSQNWDVEIPQERSPDFLESDNLREALATIKSKINEKAANNSTNGSARKIDILGMDICLMAMAEVGYQVRESVDYMVASEEAEPAESWPYQSILSDLVETPDMPPDELAVRIARKYILYFQREGKFITQSICNLNRADDMLQSLKRLARVLRDGFAANDEQVMYAVMMARGLAQSYYMKEFIDLYHFCEQLLNICETGGVNVRLRGKLSDRIAVIGNECNKALNTIRSQSNAVTNAENGGFVYDYGFYGFPLRDSNGVSIYFPCDRIEAGYAELDFNKRQYEGDVTWYDFLNEFVLEVPEVKGQAAPLAETTSGISFLKGKAGDPNKGKAGDPNKVPIPPSEHIPDIIGPPDELTGDPNLKPVPQPYEGALSK